MEIKLAYIGALQLLVQKVTDDSGKVED